MNTDSIDYENAENAAREISEVYERDSRRFSLALTEEQEARS